MQMVTSGTFQNKFGEIADLAKAGEHVSITQYGRPTLMLVSHKEGEAMLRAIQRLKALDWLDGREHTAPKEAFDLTEAELGNIINDELAK